MLRGKHDIGSTILGVGTPDHPDIGCAAATRSSPNLTQKYLSDKHVSSIRNLPSFERVEPPLALETLLCVRTITKVENYKSYID